MDDIKLIGHNQNWEQAFKKLSSTHGKLIRRYDALTQELNKTRQEYSRYRKKVIQAVENVNRERNSQ